MAGPGCWSRDQLLSLNLDAFLSLYKENEFPLELGRHLSLDQVTVCFIDVKDVMHHVCSARPSYPTAPAAGGRCPASSCVWSSEYCCAIPRSLQLHGNLVLQGGEEFQDNCRGNPERGNEVMTL